MRISRVEHCQRGTPPKTVKGVCAGLVIILAALSLLVAGCGDPLAEARELEGKGDFAGAVEVYGRVLAEDPDNTVALEEAAVDLLMLGRYDEALGLQERLALLEASDAEIRVDLGFNYLNHQARPEDAARVFAEAAGVEPSAKNLSFLAQAQIVCGRFVEAEQVLRQAISADPVYAHAYRILVRLLRDQGRDEEAAKVVEAASAQGVSLTDS